jgi:hypothetical protein
VERKRSWRNQREETSDDGVRGKESGMLDNANPKRRGYTNSPGNEPLTGMVSAARPRIGKSI